MLGNLLSIAISERTKIIGMNRNYQLASWVLFAPVVGAIQAVVGMLPAMIQHGDLRNPDLQRVLMGIALVYGGGWFIPAFLISDLFMLKRRLSRRDLTSYALAIAITALVIGFLLPGMMVMLGYPLTACAILVCGFWFRKKPEDVPVIGPTAG
jgi:membrane associated rhomboid family serine protease